MEDYRKELQIAAISFIATLGFYRTQEIMDFFKAINEAELEVNTLIGEQIKHIAHALFIGLGIILYITFLSCIASSLFYVYKNNDKKHTTSLLIAVICIFSLQIIIFFVALNNTIIQKANSLN